MDRDIALLGFDYDQSMVDPNDRLRHFQSINASNVTNTLNMLLTLTVGVAAFAVNILISAKGPLGTSAATCLISSFVSLIWCSANRDSNAVYAHRRLSKDNSSCGDGEGKPWRDNRVSRTASGLPKKTADRLNKATNILLYVQPSLFILGL